MPVKALSQASSLPQPSCRYRCRYNQESLEQAGGRETILAIPDSHSIVVYGILDGNLVIYGGTYYEDAQKQEVLDAINIMLQTTEIE